MDGCIMATHSGVQACMQDVLHPPPVAPLSWLPGGTPILLTWTLSSASDLLALMVTCRHTHMDSILCQWPPLIGCLQARPCQWPPLIGCLQARPFHSLGLHVLTVSPLSWLQRRAHWRSCQLFHQVPKSPCSY